MARGHHKQAMYPDLCKDHRRSTMVDVAASIIGILAAAGKVAETLTPIISVLKDVNKHTAIVLAEVNASRTILSQLHTYLHDLDALPGHSRMAHCSSRNSKRSFVDLMLSTASYRSASRQLGSIAILTLFQSGCRPSSCP
jgi:hypothetical protein